MKPSPRSAHEREEGSKAAVCLGLEPLECGGRKALDFLQAMVLYEEQIAESRLQIQVLTVIIGTLQRCSGSGPGRGGESCGTPR